MSRRPEKSLTASMPEVVIALLDDYGIKAVLLEGVPLIPADQLSTIEEAKHALDVLGQLGLGSDWWQEGWVLKPA